MRKFLLVLAVLAVASIIPTTSVYAWGGRVVVRQPLFFRTRVQAQVFVQPQVFVPQVYSQPVIQQRVVVRQRFVAPQVFSVPQCGIQAQAFSGGCASAAFFFVH